MPTNIEIELLRQNDMLRGAVIFAMDKIRQIRAGQKVDSTAVLETLGKQLSEARAVLAQREDEDVKVALEGRFRPAGGDFQGIRVYRSG